MNLKIILSTILLIILIPTITGAFTYNSKEFQTVIKQLDMQGHADHEFSTCTIQKVYYDEVIEMLNGGMNEAEIIQSYVDEYGQAALRTPGSGKSGIIAWVMPGIGLVIGVIILAVWLKRLTRKNQEAVYVQPGKAGWKNETEREIIEKTFEEERRKLF
ncbi:cytochrome c-type biogenesis protein CcmH [Mesobacillus harenae]|uniref:cytochrome c-type biogenesis protein CcmH n=1 Tax=Mesobacillus harenae TaxID=2213203 RepID=UPI0015804B0C|nr:cytochrome c-type biogenesis protein CcmH [Mesobacillus harenae]